MATLIYLHTDIHLGRTLSGMHYRCQAPQTTWPSPVHQVQDSSTLPIWECYPTTCTPPTHPAIPSQPSPGGFQDSAPTPSPTQTQTSPSWTQACSNKQAYPHLAATLCTLTQEQRAHTISDKSCEETPQIISFQRNSSDCLIFSHTRNQYTQQQITTPPQHRISSPSCL